MSLSEAQPAQKSRNVFTELSTRESSNTPSTTGSSNLRGASAPTDPPVDPAKSRVEVPQAGCPATPSRRPLPYIKAPGRRFTTVVVTTPDQKLGRSFRCHEHSDAQVAAELVAEAYERGKQDGLERGDARIRTLRRKLKKLHGTESKTDAAAAHGQAALASEIASVADEIRAEKNRFHCEAAEALGLGNRFLDKDALLRQARSLRSENKERGLALAAMRDTFDALSADGAEAGVQVALEHALEHLNAGRDKHARDLIHQTLNALRRKPEVAHG